MPTNIGINNVSLTMLSSIYLSFYICRLFIHQDEKFLYLLGRGRDSVPIK